MVLNPAPWEHTRSYPETHFHLLSSGGRFWRSAVVGLAGALGLAAYGYGQGWAIPRWHCVFQATLGFLGPGCGLTRSWIALAQGHGLEALRFHLLGPVLALGLGLVVLQSGGELLVGTRVAGHPWLARLDALGWFQCHARSVSGGLAVVAMVYYGLRLYGRYGSSPLPLGLEGSVVWQFIKLGAQQL